MPAGPMLDDLFERRVTYPDFDPQERLSRLVGIDDQKVRLSKILGLLVNPRGLQDWAKKFHGDAALKILDTVLRRPPLIVLEGDVGSGKTELAETIGDDVARRENIEITLFPLSLATRGQGRVGEMSQLLAAAFEHTMAHASKLTGPGGARGAVILLVDEADAIVQSRELAQMHHEDRAGVNAFIRGVDQLAKKGLPAAIILCTNRLGALDPAIRRRAADILTFSRPNEDQRRAVLAPLKVLGFEVADIEKLVVMTGEQSGRDYGFTFSDLLQRLLPAIVLDAYPERSVTAEEAIKRTASIMPTRPFQDGER